MDRRQFVKSVGITVAGFGPTSLIAPSVSHAAYPNKPVTMLVPFAAGGAGDILTRVIADHARSKRNIAVGVEYRPGAGATIAPSQVARAEPDGATLGLFSVSPFLTVPHLQKLSYDTTKDFTYIAIYAFVPLAFYVPTASPLQNWTAVLRFAKDNAGRLRWGTSGVRGVAHIAVEAALKKEGVKATFVPFTGGAQAITAMLGGHVEAVVSADYGPQLAAGKVRLLALTGAEKLAEFPQLPTFKELGYPLATEAIYGIYGPAKLAPDVVTYWEGATKEMMATDAFRGVLKTVNAGSVYMDSAAFTQNVNENYRKLGEAIEALGLKSK
jgi:tripartite-type tricarboxylate transporter receptor subunit TctC